MSGGGGSVKETEHQRALAEIARQRYNRYQNKFVPIENQYIQDVMRSRNPEQYQKAAAISAAETAVPFAKARDEVNKRMFAAGVNPNSGRAKSGSLAIAEARGLGQNVANSQLGTTDRYFRGLEGIVAMGQGQAGSALDSLQDVADRSGKYAEQAARSAAERSAGVSDMIGTGFGIGAGSYLNNNSGG